MRDLADNASQATEFLKAFANDNRLLALYTLTNGEKSVTEMMDILSMPQALTSQNLSRLRLGGLIKGRREGKQIFYSICDDRVHTMLKVTSDLFFQDQKSKQ